MRTHRLHTAPLLLAALLLALLLQSPMALAQREVPPVPWAEAAKANYPPGEPGKDYTPVFVPNGATLPFKVVDGVKIFHLRPEPIEHEVAKGITIHAWGFNGRTPGPVIEVVAGDRVRIYVTNRLPVKTAVHWHGVLLPVGQDGVYGVTQRGIEPGETFVYEFIFPHAGTFMYHSHLDTMTQEGMGLTGMIVVHPRDAQEPRPDRDFVIMLHEWAVTGGTARPNTMEMTDFNLITFNGKVFPATHPLVAQLGDRVRMRFGNLSAMDHHPIHLHGYAFRLVETDGGQVPPSAQFPETTVLVPVGSVRVVEFTADNPGDWAMHCHMTHHVMNQMGHSFPNMLGVDTSGVDDAIRRLLPGYMPMGAGGMMDMAMMRMPVPHNSIPMLGYVGQFGATVMGGMATVFKVREHAEGYADPGHYQFPAGSVARRATKAEMQRDGVMKGGAHKAHQPAPPKKPEPKQPMPMQMPMGGHSH